MGEVFDQGQWELSSSGTSFSFYPCVILGVGNWLETVFSFDLIQEWMRWNSWDWCWLKYAICAITCICTGSSRSRVWPSKHAWIPWLMLFPPLSQVFCCARSLCSCYDFFPFYEHMLNMLHSFLFYYLHALFHGHMFYLLLSFPFLHADTSCLLSHMFTMPLTWGFTVYKLVVVW